MSIAFVQYDDYKDGATGKTTVANDTALNTTTGNLLVACVTHWDDVDAVVSIADTAGNTYVKADSIQAGGNYNSEIWYAKNITGNANNITTATFGAGTSNYPAICVSEYSGADPTAPLDDTATATTSGATTHSSGNMTASTDDAVIIGSFCSSAVENFTKGTGFTDIRSDITWVYDYYEYKIISSSGTYVADATTGTTTDTAIVGAIFKGPSGEEFTETVTESITIADTIQKDVVMGALTESLAIADTISKAISLYKTESLSIADSISRVFAAKRTLTESVAITNTISTALIKIVTVSESISIADSISRVWAAKRTLSESIAIADSISRVWAAKKTLAESLSITDSLTKATTKALNETIDIADSISRVWVAKRILTETLAIADSLSKIFTAYRTLSESLSIADTISRVWSAKRTLSEDVGITDSLSHIWTAKLTLSETLAIADTVSALLTYIKVLTESISIADSLTSVRLLLKTLSETLSFSFSIRLIGILGRLARGQFTEITKDDVSDTFAGHWR